MSDELMLGQFTSIKAVSFPADVLTATINSLAKVIRGNNALQEHFMSVYSPTPPLRAAGFQLSASDYMFNWLYSTASPHALLNSDRLKKNICPEQDQVVSVLQQTQHPVTQLSLLQLICCSVSVCPADMALLLTMSGLVAFLLTEISSGRHEEEERTMRGLSILYNDGSVLVYTTTDVKSREILETVLEINGHILKIEESTHEGVDKEIKEIKVKRILVTCSIYELLNFTGEAMTNHQTDEQSGVQVTHIQQTVCLQAVPGLPCLLSQAVQPSPCRPTRSNLHSLEVPEVFMADVGVGQEVVATQNQDLIAIIQVDEVRAILHGDEKESSHIFLCKHGEKFPRLILFITRWLCSQILLILLLRSGIEKNPGPNNSDSDFEEIEKDDLVTISIRPTMTKGFLMKVNKTWSIESFQTNLHRELARREPFYASLVPQQLKPRKSKKELVDMKELDKGDVIVVIYINQKFIPTLKDQHQKFVAPLKSKSTKLNLESKKSSTTMKSTKNEKPFANRSIVLHSTNSSIQPKLVSQKPALSSKKNKTKLGLTSNKSRLGLLKQDQPYTAKSPAQTTDDDDNEKIDTIEHGATFEKKTNDDEVDMIEHGANFEVEKTRKYPTCSAKGCTFETMHCCSICSLSLCNVHSIKDPNADDDLKRIHVTDCTENLNMSKKIQKAMTSDLKAPVRNKSAFAYFLKDNLHEKNLEKDGLQKLQIKKKWNETNKITRKKYEDLAEEDLKRYQDEMRIYSKKKYEVKKKSTENIPKIKIPDKPEKYKQLERISKVVEPITKKTKEKRGSYQEDVCGICIPCGRSKDCKKCKYCLDKKENGGEGKYKKKCIEKVCVEKRALTERIVCDCDKCILPDCGECLPCRSKPKFGGTNKLKKRCEARICQKRKCPKCGKIHKNANSCCQCKRKFKTSKELNLHTCSKGHKCLKCEKIFDFPSSLKSHIKTAHKERDATETKKRKKCDICEKTFVNNQILNQHHKEIHLGIKRDYVCPHCGKQKYSKAYLEAHINIHLQGYAFKCSECDKTMNTRKAYVKHKCPQKNDDDTGSDENMDVLDDMGSNENMDALDDKGTDENMDALDLDDCPNQNIEEAAAEPRVLEDYSENGSQENNKKVPYSDNKSQSAKSDEDSISCSKTDYFGTVAHKSNTSKTSGQGKVVKSARMHLSKPSKSSGRDLAKPNEKETANKNALISDDPRNKEVRKLLKRTQNLFDEVKQRINKAIENGERPAEGDLRQIKSLKEQQLLLESQLII